MADSEPESQLPPPMTNNYKMKKKKRKIRSAEEERDEEQRPSKASRSDRSEKKKEKEKPEEVAAKEREQVGNMEAGPPWRNLQLILSLQNKDIDLPKKVELAFGYVKLRAIEQGDAETEGLETVSVSRVIAFINNWVQSLLISSEKKIRAEGYKPQTEIPGSCLDYRCWEIFKYSLEESLKLQVSLSFSRDFLRVVHCIARDVLSRLNSMSHSKETVLNGMNFDLYGIVIECISLVFSSHGGILNVNLDLWVMTAGTVLELVHKYFNHNLDCCEAGVFFLQFSCVVLEPFAKFLRIHPTRKNGFRDFIDKLLEHLLHLLDVLHLRVCGNDSGWVQNLIKFIEEVFSYGLFHPVHMDGFLSLQSTGKYVTSEEGKTRDSKVIIKSYHRHLFDKLEKILAGKNVLALSGVGEMFHLFVNCVKNQTGASARGGLRQLENDFSGLMPKESEDSINVASQKSNGSSSLNAETRKSLFDFFVQIMEPLLQEFNIYLQAELEVGPVLLDVRSTLSSTNKILVSFMHEKLYIRTEDTSERAFFNFLKVVYDMVLSFFAKITQLWPSTVNANNITDLGVLNSVAKELVTAVCYLVEIEYEVAANDLENLWLMMFSVASLCLSLPDVPDQLSLTSEILHLGCQLVNLYCELRQVNNVIVALCKAVRRLALPDCYRETVSPKFTSSEPLLCREAYAKSVSLVLCSKEFRLSIYNAIVSIPEGQVSGCIQQLKTDISESLEWVNVSFLLTAQNEVGNLDPNNSKLYFDLQLELLGRCLADLHTLVLDSLTVTAGNSNLIRVSVKDLMAVLRLSMNSLVTIQPDNVDEFLSTVTGRTLSSSGTGCKNDLLSTHWVLLFFFRLYMSCRSLYRQALSFVPPDTSRKMSDVMCDSLTAYSGKDWLERTDWTGGGYFSWILQPSASLFTIIQSVSDIYLKDKVADCAPLVFVLNTMAVQRLVDLNRLIKSSEYLLQRKEYLVQTKLMNDGGSSPDRKNRKKLKKCILKLRQEAADLTNFMMEHLPLLTKDHMSISSFDDATYKSCDAQWLCEYDRWDFGIGALNEKSLPSSLWWIICQSIDVWCTHAAKKKLKMFLSLLIQNSLLHVEGSLDEFAKQKNNEPGHLKNVTTRKISLELLRDTVLYEQKFVRRLMASRFCQILEKSVLAIFPNVGEENLKSSPNTPEFLSVFGNSSMVGSRDNHILNDCTSVANPISCSSKRLTMKCFKEQKSCLSRSVSFTDCQTLLNFLCWMPKGSSNCKSFSLYAIYILNVERLVVGSLLDCHCALYTQNLYELFRLLLSCRRVLKSLIMASCEETMGTSQSSLTLMLSQSSFPVLWLLKSLSAVIMPQHAVSENTATPEKDMTFSLMDHTSHLFLILSKYQFIHAVHFLTSTKKFSKEQNNCAVGHGGHNLDDPDPSLDSPRGIDAWKTVVLIAETLKEQTMMLLVSQKEGLCDAKARVPLSVIELINLTSITSCSRGFMWGLASALEHLDLKNYEFKTKLSRWKPELMDKLIRCIDVFAEFVNYFVRALLVEDDQLPGNFFGGHYLPMSESCDNNMGEEESFLDEKEQQNCGPVRKCSASLENKDQSDKIAWKKRFHSESPDCGDSILAQCDKFDLHCLKKLLLKGFISGENPEAAFFLRQLFIASSALLRLNLQIKRASLSIRSVPIFVGISQVLLVELANKVEVSSPSSFVWLDGVFKFLEELGSYFPLTDPTLSNNLYAKMVELHFLAIGKCIVLQGKRASLAPHDTESSTKTLDGHGLSESATSYGPYCLDEFKAMLRTSFKVFVRKPSELHLLSAIQLLERALVGVRKGCTVNYEICTGGSDGGRVSSIVAAGIDCMDLVLEFVTGRKRSSVVKRRIPSLVACLFNIILHLQGPSIFYANLITGKGDPDPGSVILMCVEVLTKVFGKHPMYQLDTCQVGQSLRIPAALFQNIFQLRISEDPAAHNSSRFLDDQDTEIVGGMNSCVVDRQFLIDLFSACCRLMSTALKHYKSETEHCITLLEDSVSVLLHCLEMVDPAAVVRKCYFTWEVREAVKCASFLRRIYEEMRQQKDVFGRHCSLFLSDYIWTYSGYGPLKTGIRREIDEALRPGVYALIDACSADDLQRLHTAFGEGPCRSTLASLQHDYKLNFQYGGKV